LPHDEIVARPLKRSARRFRLGYGKNMCPKYLVQAFMVSLLICVLANAQVVCQQTAAEGPESLRQMLAKQPNYTAMQQFLFSEGFGGFGTKGKVAKMGNRQVEVTDETIFINEPGKPTIKVFPKRKEYAEMPVEKQDDFAISSEELAKRNDVVFSSLGREKVGKYTCIKIEASYKDKKLKGMKFVFWVAPELKNLVIRSETSLGERVKFLSLLEDISLSVNEKLFSIPRCYKKVSEPDYMKRLDGSLPKPR